MGELIKGVLSKQDLFKVQSGRCFYCCKPMSPGSYDAHLRSNGYTRDHFIPKCEGVLGFNNIVLSCRDCNERKGSQDPSNKALAKYELLLSVRLSFPDVYEKDIKRIARWRLYHF
ncbi:HNH endonuclease [Vibrio phage R01]|nr:HNH endonuclease [Vibrio phage R01]